MYSVQKSRPHHLPGRPAAPVEKLRLRGGDKRLSERVVVGGAHPTHRRYQSLILLKVKVHADNVFDRDRIKLLLEDADELFPRIRHLWLDARYYGKEKGKDWVEKVLGWGAEIFKRPRRWVRVPAG